MIRVYLIDDEAPIVNELRALIDWEQYGFEIVGYSYDPEIAKKEILALRPELVISDVKMDGCSGLELFVYASAYFPAIHFCFLSAYDSFEYVSEALKLGAVRYLRKPIRKNELIEMLEDVKTNIQTRLLSDITISLSEDYVGGRNNRVCELFQHLYPLHAPEKGRIIAFYGKHESPLPMDRLATAYRVFYQDENLVLGVAVHPDLDAIIKAASSAAVSAGLSEEFSDYSLVAGAIRHARAAAKEKFITGKHGVTLYQENPRVLNLLEKINAVRSASELETLLANLKTLLQECEVKAYDLQKIYRIIFFNLVKYGIASYDEKADETSVVDDYEDIDSFLSDLKNLFPDGASSEPSANVVGEVIRDLEENYAERRSLAYYANKYNYNACYFSQLFKKVTGVSFAEYFIELKIGKAQQLIASTNLLLAEIASMVGYDDYYHFSKIYKKHTGLTPTEYRASVK